MSSRRKLDGSAAGSLWLVAGFASLVVLVQGALAQQAATAVAPAHPAVSAVEQAARDAERVRILQAELANEQQRADEAARQRAQRLTAGDTVAADEAEQARVRSLANIAALRRELAAAPSPSPSVHSARASGPVLQAGRVPDGAVAWWDVYSRPRLEPQAQSVTASPARP